MPATPQDTPNAPPVAGPYSPVVRAGEWLVKETGGRAVKAALKSQSGSTLFEVSVIKDWTPHRVVVDPATGKVVTVPAAGKRKDDD